ncbi:hypothetical protein F5Y17DRAFT_456903 [Xylariaceae sp. FL0594]|nr:hypothetical protein F5Y17DRAFT_456903 [Xylariaceae sp. FL0594]
MSSGSHLPPGDPNAGVADNVRTIIGVSVFAIFLATVPVIARLIFRKISKLPWLADDYAIVVAALISDANAASYLWALRYGFGKHIYVLDRASLVGFFKILFATFILYGSSLSFVKLSVLAFYGRIFPRNKFKEWLIVLAVATAVWWILITLLSIFECTPVQKSWDPTVPGTCIPYIRLFVAIQVLNILLDTTILVLPISAVMKLQMPRAKKISVAATFGLGGLSIIFAIVRLAILIEDIKQTDITYATPTASWSLIEPAFQIFCACLPCMTPLLKAGRKLVGMDSRSRSGSKGTTPNSIGSLTDAPSSIQARSMNKYVMMDEGSIPMPVYQQRRDSAEPFRGGARFPEVY